VEIIDTWHTSGLRGTGSHDIAVDGLLVPAGRSVSLFSGTPVEDGPLYRFPVFGLLALGIAAVALGIARGAVADVRELAAAKTGTFQSRALRERPVVQSEFAQAEAELAAARALVDTTIDRVWDRAEVGVVGDEERTALRLASTHATIAGARVADRMYDLGGGTSVRNESPLQRRFRDVHAATQHVLVAPPTWEVAGRSLLGLAPGSPGW
jgi:alkylation response protein AidB-like acyl-CoA dehydrogenase